MHVRLVAWGIVLLLGAGCAGAGMLSPGGPAPALAETGSAAVADWRGNQRIKIRWSLKSLLVMIL